MALHRLLGMRIGVPDPQAVAGFCGELGLGDDGRGGFGGTDGGTQVTVEDYAFRRLLEVRVAADDSATIDATAARLRDRGLSPTLGDSSLTVVDPATEVTFRVEVADRWEPPVADVLQHRDGRASDMDVIDDDEEWERTGRTEFGFEHVANSWGPSIPAEFIAPTDLEHLQAAWAARS